MFFRISSVHWRNTDCWLTERATLGLFHSNHGATASVSQPFLKLLSKSVVQSALYGRGDPPAGGGVGWGDGGLGFRRLDSRFRGNDGGLIGSGVLESADEVLEAADFGFGGFAFGGAGFDFGL